MQKSLAIATFAAAARTQQVNDTNKLELIVAGLLKGALSAEGFTDITKCI